MAKRLLLVLVFSLAVTIVSANECTYKTETITENGVVISTKEIKVCNETVPIQGSFWQELMYSKEGNELMWNFLIGTYYLLGGG